MITFSPEALVVLAFYLKIVTYWHTMSQKSSSLNHAPNVSLTMTPDKTDLIGRYLP